MRPKSPKRAYPELVDVRPLNPLALYQAKADGRNRSVIWSEQMGNGAALSRSSAA